MRRRRLVSAFVGVALLSIVPAASHGANGHANVHAACAAPAKGYARCHALVVADAHGKPLASASPTGLTPATIKAAYGFPTDGTAGAGKTVAIVDAFDDPSAASDLATFSSTFGLPACGAGCFTKVNQTGGTTYPRADTGWGLEISLDVQWAHAIAPGAQILLVEASSNSFSDLLAAEDYAKAHAQYVSNSWGAGEFLGESLYDSHFSQSGVSFFVSAGDSGTPAEYPSSSPNVISVGGTTLHFDGSGNLTSETGWSGGGGGCSAYETATAAQSGFSGYGQAGCGGARATPDVSLDADPASGVSVLDTSGYGGWVTVGGTSASSPMWAARSADRGAVVGSSYVYGGSIAYRDITSGNNGAPCLVGFDLCSGRGSWTGGDGAQTSDFSLSASPSSVTVTQGSSHGTTVTVTPTGGFTGSVMLTVGALPSGVTAALGTNPTTGSSSLTFTASSTAATGTSTVTITGASGTLQHSTSVSLTIQPQQTPDFSLGVSPSSRSVKHGRSTTYTVTITRVGGFSGSVSLALSGQPSGVGGTFSPNPAGSSSTLTVTTASNATRGTFTLTITGTSGSLSHSRTVSLTVR